MVLTVFHACSLLTALSSMQVQACTDGYFGDNCEFKCHCNKGQCDEIGACSPNLCHDNFFGPACQYVDLMVQPSKPRNPEFVVDHNEETCNTEGLQEFLELNMAEPVILYWIRIYVNKPTMFTEGVPYFNIIVDRVGKCANRQVFLGPNYMDITCTAIMMHSLSLMGSLVGSLCSIYISAGRNVAINQNAYQSSTYEDNEEKAGALNAVDGSTNNDFQSEQTSCSKTKNEPEDPKWSLTFNHSQIIFSVVIFSDQEEKDAIITFTLHAYNSTGDTVYTFEHNKDPTGVFIRVTEFPMEPIASISITQASNISNMLTLCEVQVFAETICPEGLFGLTCDKPCSCRYANMCHVVTGLCSSPELRLEKQPVEVKEIIAACPNGTYGDNCSLSCPSFCSVPQCERLSGDCQACDKNHYGSKCEECAPTNYGPACSLACPQGCLDYCDSKTGNCRSCKPSFSGVHCDQATSSRVLILLIGTIVACICVFLVVTYFLRQDQVKVPDSESGDSSNKGKRSPLSIKSPRGD